MMLGPNVVVKGRPVWSRHHRQNSETPDSQSKPDVQFEVVNRKYRKRLNKCLFREPIPAASIFAAANWLKEQDGGDYHRGGSMDSEADSGSDNGTDSSLDSRPLTLEPGSINTLTRVGTTGPGRHENVTMTRLMRKLPMSSDIFLDELAIYDENGGLLEDLESRYAGYLEACRKEQEKDHIMYKYLFNYSPEELRNRLRSIREYIKSSRRALLERNRHLSPADSRTIWSQIGESFFDTEDGTSTSTADMRSLGCNVDVYNRAIALINPPKSEIYCPYLPGLATARVMRRFSYIHVLLMGMLFVCYWIPFLSLKNRSVIDTDIYLPTDTNLFLDVKNCNVRFTDHPEDGSTQARYYIYMLIIIHLYDSISCHFVS